MTSSHEFGWGDTVYENVKGRSPLGSILAIRVFHVIFEGALQEA